MTVLLWIAVLVGGWCAASVVTALIMGTFLRRRREATDPRHALRPLAVGPLDFWAGLGADIPDTPAALTAPPEARRDGADHSGADHSGADRPDTGHDRAMLPAPRSGAGDRARDPEGVG